MDKDKLIKLLGILFASKLKNPDKETVLIWYDLLKGYPADKLELAIKKLIYTKDDFISIGQIHEMIYPKQDIEAVSLNAWNALKNGDKLDDNIKSVAKEIKYYYRWGECLESDNFTKNVIKKEFMTLYKDRLMQNEALKKLKE